MARIDPRTGETVLSPQEVAMLQQQMRGSQMGGAQGQGLGSTSALLTQKFLNKLFGGGSSGVGKGGGLFSGLLGGGEAATGAIQGVPTAFGTEGALMSPATFEGGILAPAESTGTLATSGGLSSFLIPAAGAAGMFDLFKNKRTGTRGILQGAASGAAMGSMFGPWGTGIGAVLGGVGSLFNKKKRTDVEQKKWQKLVDAGLMPSDWPQANEDPTGGPDFDTTWKTASPDERAKMIAGYAGLTEKMGPEYWRAGDKARLDIARLFSGGEEGGAFKEHLGTIDFNWTPEREQAAKAIMAAAMKLPEKERQKRL